MEKKVLVVEDIQSIRIAIKDLLSSQYRVFDARDYNDAINILNNEPIDLVITDIKMPGKTGLDLIRTVKDKYPNTLYALITAYNINEYIHFAKEYGVWNIIPKYSFLDLRSISVLVYKLLTRDIFGVEKYYGRELTVNNSNREGCFETPPANGLVYKTVKSDKDRTHLCERVGKFMVEKGAPNSVHQVLEELTSNAMIRAPRDSKGSSKYQYELPSRDLIVTLEKIQLAENDYFELGYGIFKKTFIIVTRDRFGSLKKEEILMRLDRHTNIDKKTGLPMGITDSHGRGLFICREISDNIIFNIHKNVCTEVIALIENSENKTFKSLSIFEIQ